MRRFSCLMLLFASLMAGCSTTQEVTLAKQSFSKSMGSAAQVFDENNSDQMNGHLLSALQKEGLSIKPALPMGTRSSTQVDVLVSYVDVWRWDIVMYLKELSVKLYDASTGDLLVLGRWADSPLHGFRDSKLVMEGLVSEMLTKARGASAAPPQ